MFAPESLKDIYADELKDLWSANDQISRVVETMATKAHDPKLKKSLEASVKGIDKHTDALKALLKAAGEEVEKEHCKGMEGLVKEPVKHVTKEAPVSGELLDIVILAQYQRMTHYGLAGFISADAYANALGRAPDAAKLKAIVADIYKADQYASQMTDKVEKMASTQS